MAIQSVVVNLNGTNVSLTYNSESGLYEGTLTAPSTSSYNQTGGFYGMTVTATDDAGNSTIANTTTNEELKLVVKETVAPVCTITNPTSGAYVGSSSPTITWTVTDDDSGVDASTIYIKIDGTSKTSGITKTPITNGYSCSYSESLAEGSHTIKVGASDNDGNVATEKSVTFTVDTIPPVLTVVSPTDNFITNTATLTVSGMTNDATSTPVTLKVNDEVVTVDASGNFSTTVTLTEGSNSIRVVATDAGGKESVVTRTVTLNTHAPEIVSITVTPNPVDSGRTFVVAVNVTE